MKETRWRDGHETGKRQESRRNKSVQSWLDCRDWTGIKRDRLNGIRHDRTGCADTLPDQRTLITKNGGPMGNVMKSWKNK
jgi:hypothetical protein